MATLNTLQQYQSAVTMSKPASILEYKHVIAQQSQHMFIHRQTFLQSAINAKRASVQVSITS